MKRSRVILSLLVLLAVLCLFSFMNVPPVPSIHLVSYEWDVKVIDWEHEYVEANITLLNSGNGDAEFVLEIDLYDDDTYFTCQLWDLELSAGAEETFTRTVLYELLINHHHANAIEIICGIYGEDDCLVGEPYFREFSSKSEGEG